MKLLDGIAKIFKHPRRRFVYAVTDGDYMGEFLVYMEQSNDKYVFLSLPDLHVRYISDNDIQSAIKSNVLDVVEKLPSEVYSVCCIQYRDRTETTGTGANVHSNTLSDT